MGAARAEMEGVIAVGGVGAVGAVGGAGGAGGAGGMGCEPHGQGWERWEGMRIKE